MVALLLLLTFIGFYLCYSTSKRMVIPNTLRIEGWSKRKSSQANSIGGILLLISCSLSIIYFGWGAGIFTFSILLMTLASIIILLQPLKLITYTTVGFTIALFLISELFLF